eukprot:6210880-Pleurochrysis_carterae.AAC.1
MKGRAPRQLSRAATVHGEQLVVPRDHLREQGEKAALGDTAVVFARQPVLQPVPAPCRQPTPACDKRLWHQQLPPSKCILKPDAAHPLPLFELLAHREP